MAETINLNAEQRTTIKHGIKALRRAGNVPAVVYGHNIAASHVQVNERDLATVLRTTGRNTLITLNVSGVAQPKMVLTREVQRDPVKRSLVHVDFYEVSMTEKLSVEVRLVFFGESMDVKGGQGVLIKEMDSLSVRCLPQDLIEEIKVDVSKLNIDQAIKVSDLNIPAGIEVMEDKNDEVARVSRYVEAKVEEAATTTTAEVEVIEKGKKEEEGAEGAAAAKKK